MPLLLTVRAEAAPPASKFSNNRRLRSLRAVKMQLQMLKHKIIATKDAWETPRIQNLEKLTSSLSEFIEGEQKHWLDTWEDITKLSSSLRELATENDDDKENQPPVVNKRQGPDA